MPPIVVVGGVPCISGAPLVVIVIAIGGAHAARGCVSEVRVVSAERPCIIVVVGGARSLEPRRRSATHHGRHCRVRAQLWNASVE